MLDVGPVAADARLDHLAIVGVRAYLARQREQHQRLVQRDLRGLPALRQRGARRLGLLLGRFAALHVGAEAPLAQADRIVAVVAQQLAIGANLVPVLHPRRAEGTGVAALGVVRAADEGAAGARGAHRQPPGAAVGAGARVAAVLAGRVEMRRQHLVDLVQHFRDAQVRRLCQMGGEVAPEAGQHVLPVTMARAHVVKLVLELGGEIVAHVLAEIVGQEGGHQPPLVLRDKAVLVLPYVAAILDRGHDRGIGGGAADTEFLHLLDQRRLGVAGRRLGEMLLGRDGALFCRLSLGDLRQALVVILGRLVAALFIDPEKAVEEHDLTGGAQAHLAVRAAHLDGRALQPRGLHLAGKRALPDQIVELALVGVRQAQRGRVLRHLGGADALVRFLRVLRLVLVHPGRAGNVVLAEAVADRIAGGVHRLWRHVDPVGPHVGDVACLVEALRRAHRLLRAHAELAAGFLLQRRGHEGRRGVAGGRLRLDRGHGQLARGDGLHGELRRFLAVDVEFLQLPAAQHRQPRLVGLAARRGKLCGDGPVFLRAEGLDLHLALDDQAQADGLHAPRGFRARQLAPEHGAQVEADKIVERAARQIGLDQRRVDVAGIAHRLGHRRLGDRVEDYPPHRRVLPDRAALAQRLFEMPRDCLALAVGVGGEDQLGVVLERLGDGADVLLAVAGDLPFHLEPVLWIDGAVLRRQVADMPVGGEHRVIRAQILVDCLGLGRGLDDDDGHVLRRSPTGVDGAGYGLGQAGVQGRIVNRPRRGRPARCSPMPRPGGPQPVGSPGQARPQGAAVARPRGRSGERDQAAGLAADATVELEVEQGGGDTIRALAEVADQLILGQRRRPET